MTCIQNMSAVVGLISTFDGQLPFFGWCPIKKTNNIVHGYISSPQWCIDAPSKVDLLHNWWLTYPLTTILSCNFRYNDSLIWRVHLIGNRKTLGKNSHHSSDVATWGRYTAICLGISPFIHIYIHYEFVQSPLLLVNTPIVSLLLI